MQRKPFWKLLLLGIGYMALGNVMSTVMTVAASVIADIAIITAILFLMTLFIFYSLVFTVAYKDGQREHLMLKNHRTNGPVKGRWTIVGIIMYVIMCIPSVILLLDSVLGLFVGYLIPYRMICGMIYPLALLTGVNYPETSQMPPYFALVFMLCYIFIPVVTTVGFSFGFNDKFNPDKMMYEKK